MRFDTLPRLVLPDVAWSFIGCRYADVAHFAAQVGRELHVLGCPPWAPEFVVLPAPRILVSYRRGGDDDDGLLDLSCNNPEGFTALDLLFQIHNAIVDEVGELDRHFFEGLTLNSAPVGENPPLLTLRLGS